MAQGALGSTSEPAWQVATLYPDQGDWWEEDYLRLPGNRLIELADGCIEILPMPTLAHQRVLIFLSVALYDFVRQGGHGEVLCAPVPMQLAPGRFRMPDVVFISRENAAGKTETHLNGADLVMEIVNPEERGRDTILKRREYAQAGIGEYWIVDIEQETISVLTLRVRSYIAHGTYRRGERAVSVLLEGFGVDVDDVLAAAEG